MFNALRIADPEAVKITALFCVRTNQSSMMLLCRLSISPTLL
jgi:hypothetical protein